MTSKCRVCSNT